MGPFLIMSLALRFPDADLIEERPEVLRAAAALEPTPAVRALRGFLDWWGTAPADTLQRTYTEAFDFSRRTCLDLTYYAYGDRRQRGLALLKLRQRYSACGMELDGPELPDHLPVLLEFVDACPQEGGAMLAEFRPVIELMRMALARTDSPYTGAVEALCLTLPELTPEEHLELLRMAKEGPPTEEVGLEPFAPPEVMPEPRRAPVACGTLRRPA